MSKKLVEGDVKQWLKDNFSHILLISWGGNGSAKSIFVNEETGYEFTDTFVRVRNRLRKGMKVGGRATVGGSSGAVPGIIRAFLKKKAPHVVLLKCADKISDDSLFKNLETGREFEFSFSDLKYQLRHGSDVGIFDAPRLTFTTASDRLQKITSRYELVNFTPGKSSKSTFRRISTGALVQGYFNSFCQSLKRSPQYILAATKEEHSEVRRLGSKLASQRCFKKYGVHSYSSLPEAKEKIEETRKSCGLTNVVDGETYQDIAHRIGASYSYVQSTFKRHDKSTAKLVCSWFRQYTDIEIAAKQLLSALDISFVHNKILGKTSYRPDFVLPEHKLILECDGLYWHSESVIKDKYYHKNKLAAYAAAGYRAYFFRSDEITHKFPIVQSIIKNALNMNPHRVYARKCSIQKIDSSFFRNYHLMGKGVGRATGLVHEGTVVCGIQSKWISKKENNLEISRFCSAPGTTVVGGFSKLIRYLEKEFQPSSIKTFIDKRYGSGEYLSDLGFEHKGTYLSFKWTDGAVTYHRMKYPKNSGLDVGLQRIWDCGQAKWLKSL